MYLVFFGVIILTFIVIGGLAYYMMTSQVKKIIIQFTILAKKLGLNIKIPDGKWSTIEIYPSLEGQLNGMPFSFSMYNTNTGIGTTSCTIFKLTINPSGGNKVVQISKEGVMGSIYKASGAKDVQVGDEAFDKKFIVETNNMDFLQKLLQPKTKNMILAQEKNIVGFLKISEKEIIYDAVDALMTDKRREVWEDLIQLALNLSREL